MLGDAKKRFILLAVVCQVAGASGGLAEVPEPPASKAALLSPTARTVLLTVGVNATIATVSYFAFWQGEGQAFHFKNDGWFDRHQHSLGADKVGHAWSAYQLTNFSAWGYRKLGVSEPTANLVGMLNAQLALLVMEVGDGMSPYGFSRQDVISNAAGALFAYSRLRWPIVRDLTDFKLTYQFRSSTTLRGGDQEAGFFENYDDMTYWLVLRGKRILPRPVNFLGLALGYHTEGYHYWKSYLSGNTSGLRPRKREWLVGLDIDWSELLKVRQPLLQGLVTVFNIYHLPFLPALKSTTHVQ
jgi:hypothetical protein